LAPVLFNQGINWIMEHADGLMGIKVGDFAFKDLDYPDDIALPVSLPTDLPTALAWFFTASNTMGLDHVLWKKTKI